MASSRQRPPDAPSELRSSAAFPARSIVEKMLKVWATFDYGSRSLFKVGLYSFQERSPHRHLSALFQGISSVASLSSGCCSRTE